MKLKELKKGKWTDRKFWTVMAWQAVLCLGIVKGVIGEDTLVNLTYLLLGGYLVSGIAEKKIDKDSKEDRKEP